MLLTQLRAYVINHFQIYNTTTCHTVLDKMHARQLKMVTAIKLSCVCFGLKKKKEVWIGTRAGWTAFKRNQKIYKGDPWKENRLSSYQNKALATLPLEDYWHTGAWARDFFTSLSDWVAASRFTSNSPPSPSADLGLVMPRPCHKDCTFRWEKLRKCIEKLKKAMTLSLKWKHFFFVWRWGFLVFCEEDDTKCGEDKQFSYRHTDLDRGRRRLWR